MGREVITEKDVRRAKVSKDMAGGGTPPPDEYTDRLMKYIPSEIVSLYILVSGVLVASKDQIPEPNEKVIQWVIFILLTALTPLYMRFTQNVTKKVQLIIVTVSFMIWVFTLGGPFAQFKWYLPVYGALLLPIYTFAIAMVKPEK